MNCSDPAIQFLLQSNDPSVRYFTLTDLLDASSTPTPALPRAAGEGAVQAARKEIPNGARVCALLAGQGAAKRVSRKSYAAHPGGFGVHPYKKWDGAHWRLVSLVELGIAERPEGFSKTLRVLQAADQVLTWLTSDEHRARIQRINGRTRRCGSQEGNALAVCSRLGMTDDPRVQYLARALVEWQWDDGGWNCDVNPRAHHSSFYESLAPLWGLIEYHRVTQDESSLAAAERAAELFLRHRLFRSEKIGEVIDKQWLKLHYPLYYHYDILQALVILARAGKARDPRAQQALDIIESKRQLDGTWRAEGFYWKLGKPCEGSQNLRKVPTSNVEVVDWGRRGPNEMITLNALRVLKAAGRVN